jgi:hypothetical protein
MNDPLESWEIIFYPLVAFGVVLWKNWPPVFYWSQLLRLEVLLWGVAGVIEFYHWRQRIPLLSRAILIGLPMSLIAALVMPGNPRVMYWAALGLFLYLGLLGLISNRFERWRDKHKRH